VPTRRKPAEELAFEPPLCRVAQSLQFKAQGLDQRTAGATVSSQNRQVGPTGEHSRIGAVSCVFETATSCKCSAMEIISDRSNGLIIVESAIIISCREKFFRSEFG
jgi:hypothetical protein